MKQLTPTGKAPDISFHQVSPENTLLIVNTTPPQVHLITATDGLGRRWIFHGGAHCGCDDGACSIPVYHCDRCVDYDYGDNAEAAEIRAACVEVVA